MRTPEVQHWPSSDKTTMPLIPLWKPAGRVLLAATVSVSKRASLQRSLAALVASLILVITLSISTPSAQAAGVITCSPALTASVTYAYPTGYTGGYGSGGSNLFTPTGCTVSGATPTLSGYLVLCSATPLNYGLHANPATQPNLESTTPLQPNYTMAYVPQIEDHNSFSGSEPLLNANTLIMRSTFVTLGNGATSPWGSEGAIIFWLINGNAFGVGQGGTYPAPGSYTDTVTAPLNLYLNSSPSCGGTLMQILTLTANYTLTVGTYCAAASTSTLSFGTFFNLTAPISQSGTVGATCSPTTPYSITLGDGMNPTAPIASGGVRRMASGGNFLQYILYSDAAHTQQWTTATGIGGSGAAAPSVLTAPTTIPVYGLLPTTGNPSNPMIGTYQDTVVTTVTY